MAVMVVVMVVVLICGVCVCTFGDFGTVDGEQVAFGGGVFFGGRILFELARGFATEVV